MAHKLVVDLKARTQKRVPLTAADIAQREKDAARPPKPYQPSPEEVLFELSGKTQEEWDAARAAISARKS